VRLLLDELRQLNRAGLASRSWDWLLLLDADAAIVSDEDVLRNVLQSGPMSKATHAIVCAHGRVGKVLDSGVVLVKVGSWSEGFLVAWLQELSTAHQRNPDMDRTLSQAVQRARRLGGPSSVIELPAGTLSADLRELAYASVRTEPVVRLLGAADEVREHFFRNAWLWACRRPGGLGGRAPAVLQQLHLAALAAGARSILRPRQARPLALRRGGRVLQRQEHAGAVFDALAGYAPMLAGRGEEGAGLLRLCVAAYEWASAGDRPGAQNCRRHAARQGAGE